MSSDADHPTATDELSSGRVRQRRRTRRALLLAAGELVEAGRTPTVAEAADAADVSRATAYRYFPSQDALLAEAVLLSDTLTVEGVLGPSTPTASKNGSSWCNASYYDHISARETQFRHFLRGEASCADCSKGTTLHVPASGSAFCCSTPPSLPCTTAYHPKPSSGCATRSASSSGPKR